MSWYDELQKDLIHWRRRDWLEDIVMRAGLAHVAGWSEVDRMLEALTKRPWDLSHWITVDELLQSVATVPEVIGTTVPTHARARVEATGNPKLAELRKEFDLR